MNEMDVTQQNHESAVQQNAAEEVVERMEDYKEELERSFRKLSVGDIVTGTIVSISEEELVVDLAYYAPGRIALEEISEDPDFVVEETYHVGESVSATIVRMDDGAGNIVLSMKEATKVLGWERLIEDMEQENVLTVRTVQSVKAGVIAYARGLRGFIPASQLSLSYVEDLDEWVNKVLKVVPINVDQESGRLVLSAKVVLQKEKEEELHKRMSRMIPGETYEGTVESLMPYGAFINLGEGISGLVHISRISQKRLNHPSEALKVGQNVKVKLIDMKDGKLSFSMKEFEEISEPVEISELEDYTMETEEIGTSLGNLLHGLNINIF